MSRRRTLTVLLLAAVASQPLPTQAATSESATLTFGRSAEGVQLTATSHGPTDAETTVLVVGVIHGNETAGVPVIRRLRRLGPPAGVRYVLVTAINPDGKAARTRHNARGVDLNRNFPYRWQGGGKPWDVYFPGPKAASERETRGTMNLIKDVKPDLTIWYHQHLTCVTTIDGRPAYPRQYAGLVGLPMCMGLPSYRGTATSWQNATFTAASAFVVELPAGQLPASSVRKHVSAVRELAVTAQSAENPST